MKKFKKLLAVLVCVVMVVSALPVTSGILASAASSGTTGDCTWTLDGTVLTISGNGAMANYSYGSILPWGNSITEVIIEDGVTSIGDYAFENCTSLTSITIPESVTCIGSYAFRDCTSLTSITIPDSVTSIGVSAFEGCTSLESITIPDSVTSIGDFAFYGCTSLTSVTILDGVTSIGEYAFSSCTSLTSITIPDSVTSIGNDAFSYCTSLTNITIPDSVTSIGDWVFSYCESLTSVTIPDSVESLGDYAFSDCTSLTSITIPDSVTSVGYSAFSYCTSLTSITIPDSVESLGDYAFYNCTSLTSVYYKGNDEDWADVTIGSGNDYLKNANFTFNYDPITFVAIAQNPTKTIYEVGESLDFSGAKLVVGYPEGNYEFIDITESMVSGFNPNKPSIQVLTVTYKGYTDVLVVTVFPKIADDENEIDILDLIYIKNALLSFGEDYPVSYDVNLDGDFNSLDMVALRKKVFESF